MFKSLAALFQGKCSTILAATILFFALANPLLAGGGPENVFVVVNSSSWQSKTVANHFIQLRKIPASNICYVPWDGSLTTPMSVEDFRNKILQRVLVTMAQRGVAGQIDYIVYSSDFPEAVDLKSDFQGKKLPPEVVSTIASITGATYYYQRIMSKNVGLLNRRANQYMRYADTTRRSSQPLGFSSWKGWAPNGALQMTGGEHYILSVMLGVTSGTRGNSISEIVNYLSRSTSADGTHPRGTIYYVKNTNVRSTAREVDAKTKLNRFSDAVARLRALGVNAQIVEGKIPLGKSDVMGAMIGTSSFKWRTSGSKILPGAICEHLTSYGGILRKNKGQTPLTELLRHGAAGASGTVFEPYALQDKFPHPMIHVYYAQGCSLAESFYQSVFGPYQLLIVGEPLCQPWANIPRVSVAGITPGSKLKGVVKFKPAAQFSPAHRGTIDHYELFVDGRRHSKCLAQSDFSLDTRTLYDGHHELRVVAISQGSIETQGRWIGPISVDNHGHSITLSSAPGRSLRSGQSLTLTAKAPGADKIVLRYHHQVFQKTIDGPEGRLKIDSKILGQGPVTLYALAIKIVDKKPRIIASAKPITLVISGSSR